MQHYPPTIRQLIKAFTKLPGIGEKTAERLSMHVLKAPKSQVEDLARSLIAVKEKVGLCRNCFVLTDGDMCELCRDPARDASVLCVVEQPADMAAVEKSGAFKGLYHVLQGALSPMDGVGPEDIRIRELIARVRTGKVKEVVLATGTGVEGESTAAYIAGELESLPVKVTRIASGVPIGGDLKFVDQVTLRRAMESRHDIR